ncbi:hypothetical protein [Chitinophaga agri]|uniref:Uncharacterized protein n=1 Tax=Chitinophaga agri TaxID=2703787 RepID=A0A6B9ZI80_9BACT|nr:hypothetical protein [Chitinophaga agri]QHS61044.1 hypothetical protein GWR21_15990 [Chitinophaga agri]
MKKAKIALIGIIFLTVGGGALAFKVVRGLNPAYTYLGSTTWISTVVGTLVYSTTAPVCVRLSIGPSIAFISNVGIPAQDVYRTTLTNTVFTTTTSFGGPTVSTTRPTTICHICCPLAQTFISTIQ